MDRINVPHGLSCAKSETVYAPSPSSGIKCLLKPFLRRYFPHVSSEFPQSPFKNPSRHKPTYTSSHVLLSALDIALITQSPVDLLSGFSLKYCQLISCGSGSPDNSRSRRTCTCGDFPVRRQIPEGPPPAAWRSSSIWRPPAASPPPSIYVHPSLSTSKKKRRKDASSHLALHFRRAVLSPPCRYSSRKETL